MDGPPKIIRPTASRSFTERNDKLDLLTKLNQAIVSRELSEEDGQKKPVEDPIQSSNSAFNNYERAKKTKEISAKSTLDSNKVNKVYNSKNSLVSHQNFRISEEANSHLKNNSILPLIGRLRASLGGLQSNCEVENSGEEVK